MVRLVGHSNDLWPRPLQVKHSIWLVLLFESFVPLALGVIADALELEVPSLGGVAR